MRRHPYSAFGSCTYSTIFSFPITAYFIYTSGTVLTIRSTSFYLSVMFVTSSWYSVRKYPGISTIYTSLSLYESMTNVISIALRDTVGDIAYSLDDPSLYFLPSAQARHLTLPSRLSFSNISDSRASYFTLSVRFPAVSGLKVLFMWICSNSLDTAFFSLSLNYFSPLSRDTFVIEWCITEAERYLYSRFQFFFICSIPYKSCVDGVRVLGWNHSSSGISSSPSTSSQ